MINLFYPLLEELSKINIDNYFIGVPGNKEYYMSKTSVNDNRCTNYFFDFVIPEIKLIVEYNGSRWHYNDNYDYSYLTEEKCWKAFPSVDKMKNADNKKIRFIKNKGYTLINVFDTDNFVNKIKLIIETIKEKYETRNNSRNEN